MVSVLSVAMTLLLSHARLIRAGSSRLCHGHNLKVVDIACAATSAKLRLVLGMS